ncbi:MAG: hypothetical protein JO112_02105 [Planctomycetes bacterium]|nr:hypothetical protein [Planctomycetota bacterium]
MIPTDLFPRLTLENHRITSPADNSYNCVAWSAKDVEHWWQPGVFWPVELAADDHGIGALEQAFLQLGFQDCPDGSLEVGFEKVALYGSGFMYTHAARQLPDGRWTSKLGGAEDIEHQTPHDVAGGLYGELVQFMKRPIPEAK